MTTANAISSTRQIELDIRVTCPIRKADRVFSLSLLISLGLHLAVILVLAPRFYSKDQIIAGNSLDVSIVGDAFLGDGFLGDGRAADLRSDNVSTEHVEEISPKVEDINKKTIPLKQEDKKINVAKKPQSISLIEKVDTSNVRKLGALSGSETGTIPASFGISSGSNDGSINSEYIRPQIVYAPKPEYPLEARERGFEGAVYLNLVIGSYGEVKEVLVDKSSGRADCDSEAISVVKNKWKFKPAINQGQPVQAKQLVQVVYKLFS